MNRQKSSGIALIWVLSGIVIVGIVALFIYGIVNRPPNRHIGDGKAWNEKMLNDKHFKVITYRCCVRYAGLCNITNYPIFIILKFPNCNFQI